MLGEDGRSQLTDVERDCEVDVALRWGIGYETTVRSFVNIIATPKGGITRPVLSRACCA